MDKYVSYMVCAFVEPQTIGRRFKSSEWPLHVTVVPWFRLKNAKETFNNALQKVLKRQLPFNARVLSQDHTRYSRRGVSLLDPSQWQGLHENILRVVSRHAGIVATKLYIGPYYRPHVTFQKAGHLNPYDDFYCDSLYIIKREGPPLIGEREVVNRLMLDGNETTA